MMVRYEGQRRRTLSCASHALPRIRTIGPRGQKSQDGDEDGLRSCRRSITINGMRHVVGIALLLEILLSLRTN
jgi:hypothetical protein